MFTLKKNYSVDCELDLSEHLKYVLANFLYVTFVKILNCQKSDQLIVNLICQNNLTFRGNYINGNTVYVCTNFEDLGSFRIMQT
jgi:hypothetical protein